jgi:CubicO group peptidase (beta-lactamase class C family)
VTRLGNSAFCNRIVPRRLGLSVHAQRRNAYPYSMTTGLCLLLFWHALAHAGAGSVAPESVGLRVQGLEAISRTLQGHVNEGELAGATALISRQGRVAYCQSFGHMDLEAQRPMSSDALFRIASMTKAVTAVAVLQLWEQGHFQLDDPIDDYLPVFKQARVLDPNQAGARPNRPRTIPLSRPITIRDLLRHSSGILYGGRPYREAGLNRWEGSLEGFVKTLAALPLACQPGSRFHYSYSTDVLGYLVEVVAKEPLDEYFHKHIFAPLAMQDTAFVVPRGKVNRLTCHYEYKDGDLLCREKAVDSPFLKRAEALSGGGGWSYSYPGLISTVQDWWRFLEMLRRQGEYQGQRVLRPKTVAIMCSDHLGEIPGAFEPGTGHGLAVGIVTDSEKHGQLASTGTVFWAGGPHNTYYFVDFAEQMCGILFMQNGPFGHLDLMRRFLMMSHEAIHD